ncbi:extracellular solute-binding protein [Paenibacillus sepulcri]|uniref:Extracellular solute-binding protein n=1 Tax=Paenibacillus sepulcri TaxID=359917 RepID=A0ABS7BYG1_9BACL|nr:extracellular solute-binding protein [Paenibacillus sepulcri]
MSRRKLVVLLLGICTICTALLVPMIGKPGSPNTISGGLPSEEQPLTVDNGSEDVATVRIAVSMSETEFQYWQKSEENFESRFPQIRVDLANIPGPDAYAKWKEAAHGGEPFDIMLLDNNRVREFAVQGYLLPADDIYTGDSLADQLEALTDTLKWNGSMWGVALDINPMLIVWQTELLKQAGMNEPPENWESFVKGYNGLQAASPKVEPVSLAMSDPRQMLAWLGMFDSNAEDAANLHPMNAEMKEQLRFLGPFSRPQTEQGAESGKNTVPDKLKSGELLSAVMPWSEYRSMMLSNNGSVSAGPQRSPLSWIGGRSFVLSAQSLWPDQARLWINEMVIKGSQLDRYETFGRLPARKSAYAGEFESDSMAKKPPYWVLSLFKSKVFIPDPSWSERWERWTSLWKTDDRQPFEALDMEKMIENWNGS